MKNSIILGLMVLLVFGLLNAAPATSAAPATQIQFTLSNGSMVSVTQVRTSVNSASLDLYNSSNQLIATATGAGYVVGGKLIIDPETIVIICTRPITGNEGYDQITIEELVHWTFAN
jgi:expansin (peptidoglycan-binding protein)